jgi:Na+(H+)/acetate symporter ActP
MTHTNHGFTVGVFAVLFGLSVWILIRTSRRMKGTRDSWAAGHSIPGPLNGVAI